MVNYVSAIIGLLIITSVAYDLVPRIRAQERIGAFTLIFKGLLFLAGIVLFVQAFIS